jgi:hypothetical protein
MTKRIRLAAVIYVLVLTLVVAGPAQSACKICQGTPLVCQAVGQGAPGYGNCTTSPGGCQNWEPLCQGGGDEDCGGEVCPSYRDSSSPTICDDETSGTDEILEWWQYPGV